MLIRLTIFASAACALALSTTLALAGPGAAGHKHKMFAAGEPGDPQKPVVRTVEVTMHETGDAKMLFSPNQVEVKRGEQVKFVLKNAGKADHEFMLDSVANNAKHKIAMEKNPDMEHDDPNGKRLAPDASSEIVWRFTKAGTFEFACLIPGHYEAGMKGTVFVK
jgi:uncharacterized cupredoxin-like copper-binding protein